LGFYRYHVRFGLLPVRPAQSGDSPVPVEEFTGIWPQGAARDF